MLWNIALGMQNCNINVQTADNKSVMSLQLLPDPTCEQLSPVAGNIDANLGSRTGPSVRAIPGGLAEREGREADSPVCAILHFKCKLA